MTFTLEPSKYLPYLTKKFLLKGGKMQEHRVENLQDLCGWYDAVINCSGVQAHHLAGDSAVAPIRGQVLRVSFSGILTFIYTDILCCINRFTSLCKNLFNLLEFLTEAFRCHVHHFQCLTVPVPWTWHRKASAKNSSKLNKFLHSEVNLLI